MERLSRTAQRTKTKLMDAALALFKERGFDSVTIDEITQTAGVAKGTFYTYFGTKSDIIVDAFWEIDAYYETYSSKNLSRYKTARDKLLAFTRAQMKYVRDVVGNNSLKILYANQAAQPGSNKMITNRERKWHSIVRDVILEGQAAGEFRTDLDANRLSQLFNRSARGVFLDWCVQDAAFDLVKEGVAVMRDFVMAALENTPRQ
ncbi:MAG: TetR/AcrR family transcriptional regulator [Spirochaetales bacterium]|nr:TetR/AcrR family transcriptional regulator [Spirochaetales bacterium]